MNNNKNNNKNKITKNEYYKLYYKNRYNNDDFFKFKELERKKYKYNIDENFREKIKNNWKKYYDNKIKILYISIIFQTILILLIIKYIVKNQIKNK